MHNEADRDLARRAIGSLFLIFTATRLEAEGLEIYLQALDGYRGVEIRDACERLRADWGQRGAPLPKHIKSEIHAQRRERRDADRESRQPEFSPQSARAAILRDVQSGAQRWYVERVIRPALDAHGINEPLEVPDWWPWPKPHEEAELEGRFEETSERFGALCFSAPHLARTLARVSVPGFAKNLR